MKILDLNKDLISNEVFLSEKELSNIFFNKWKFIFPEYQLIGKEFQLSGEVRNSEKGGRIDFLAYNSESKSFVIIELKNTYDKNIRSQIFDYADFIEDNYNYIVLKAKEVIRDLNVKKGAIELVLVSKEFKSNDYTRIDRYDYYTRLMTYNYFRNHKLLIDIVDNRKSLPKKATPTFQEANFISEKTEVSDILSFWRIINDSIKDYSIVSNLEYKMEGQELILRLNKIYEKYTMHRFNQKLPFISYNYLRDQLKQSPEFIRIKNCRFGKDVTMGIVFDLIELKKNAKIE